MEIEGFTPGQVDTIAGPTRTIITKPSGYKSGTLPAKPPYPPLKWGQQILNQDFFLDPDGVIAGYVEDENGNAIESDVEVEGLSKTTTKLEFTYGNNAKSGAKPSGNNVFAKVPSGSRQVFKMEAPSGNNRKIKIEPTDKGYSILDTSIIIPKAGSKEPPLIKFIVYKEQKRVRFRIIEKPPSTRLNLPGGKSKSNCGSSSKT